MMNHLLTYIIFSPLIGIAIMALVPRKFEEGVRVVALATSLATAALTYLLWIKFRPSPEFSFQEAIPWIPSLNINYHLGVDGASLLLVALTSILTPIAIAASWNEIKKYRKEFYSLILACQIGLLGAFLALDLFLFYIFWEVMLIPMYFMIGIWGSGNRIRVALKFLLFTMAGSVIMLVGVIYLYLAAGNSFDMTKLAGAVLSQEQQLWLFTAFALAFAIKVPIFPFHTWLPDAHTEAPTAGSILLAGVFLKVGAYGFFRIAMPYFPEAVAILRPYIFILATVSIIYGALVSMVQTDLKRLIAYSSVSHLGFVMLGLIALDPEGAYGAVIQMVNHGFSTGALFLLFGMLYSRSHTREIKDYGGVAKVMPLFSGIFVLVGLSSLGLPGLNNFVGEILVLLGTFKVRPVFAIVSATGTVFAAIYILWAIQRVFFGAARNEGMKDISAREIIITLPLLVAIVWLGVYPNTVLFKASYSVGSYLKMSKRLIVEEQVQPLNVIMPEVYKRKPAWVIPEIPSDQIPTPNPMGDVNEIEKDMKDTDEKGMPDLGSPAPGDQTPDAHEDVFPSGANAPGEVVE